MSLTKWNGSIIVPPNAIYTVTIVCGHDYPEKPPQIRLHTRALRDGVIDAEGRVNVKSLMRWDETKYIQEVRTPKDRGGGDSIGYCPYARRS